MANLTRQQIDQMKAQGLSESRIKELADEKGLKMPSASIGGFLGKAARFTGVEKLGQGLGFALFRLTPEYKDLERGLTDGSISPEQFEELTTGELTTGEVLGSAARTAGTVIGAGQLLRAPTRFGVPGTTFSIRKGAAIGALQNKLAKRRGEPIPFKPVGGKGYK